MSEDKRKQELMEEESAPAKECQEESGEVQAEAGEEGLEEAAAEDRQADTAEESEAAEGSDITGEEEPGREEKKSFFKKKKDPRDERIEALTDQVKRQMAEFENFRKRTDKEKSAMYEMGARDIIERILPVVDNLERGLAAVPEAEKGSSIAEGMEKIYKQFQKTLEEAGVKAIEAVGQEFNPDFHNAVMHVEDEALDENVVTDVFSKGYKLGDRVLRHAMVKVAN